MGGKTEDRVLMGRVALQGAPTQATLPIAWSLDRASMQIFILFLFFARNRNYKKYFINLFRHPYRL
jgi:hypothetical protein